MEAFTGIVFMLALFIICPIIHILLILLLNICVVRCNKREIDLL